MAKTAKTQKKPASARLFPADLQDKEWVNFKADGFSCDVTGVIYRTDRSSSTKTRDRLGHEFGFMAGGLTTPNGMPLGGVDTGCIDLEFDGTYGHATIFNTHTPRRPKIGEPLFGINVAGQTWLLTTAKIKGLTDNDKIKSANRIDYWGHYPVADMEFEMDCPINVGLRAWTPFIPGDVPISNTPCAVFEIHLRNEKDCLQKGTIAFNFPGPTKNECLGDTVFKRVPMGVSTGGMYVYNSTEVGYAVGFVSPQTGAKFGKVPVARTGAALHNSPAAWANIDKRLPQTGIEFYDAEFRPDYVESGSSVAIDFELEAGQSRVIPIFLSWYAPRWFGSGQPDFRGNEYRHMYAKRYWSAMEIAQMLTWSWRNLSRRISSWQQAIYASDEIPGWLADTLINSFHLITEDSMWAQAKPPIGKWCREEDGLFGMNECPHCCAQIECLPCSMVGNYPLVFFFPELALSTLRGYNAYQYPTGQAPWVFGGGTCSTGASEMTKPGPGYQTTTTGPYYVVLVDRLWQATGDDNILKESYEAVKKSTMFTMRLRPEWGAAGIVSVPSGDEDTMGPEFCEWFGMGGYVGGIHLMNLRIAKRMADAMGDKEFAEQCEKWFAQGSKAMEDTLWAKDYYLANYDPQTGKKTDAVFAFLFEGQWFADHHGLDPVFRPDRLKTGLATIKETCVPKSPYSVVNFVNRDGTEAVEGVYGSGYEGKDHSFPVYTIILAMNYMYTGQMKFGTEMARKCMHNIICRNGLAWNAPNIVRGDTGEAVFGTDYYQNMLVWLLPLAMTGNTLSSVHKSDSLIQKIIRAGQ